MSDNPLLSHLLTEDFYPHPVKHLELIETHISWVILTGDYVYKIKKPLDLGFLDFSSLEKRQHYCNAEVELNKTLAPDIYLDVLPITGSETAPELNGSGDAIEYVIKMREFSQECLFTELLSQNKLQATHILQTATALADFHSKVPCVADDSPYGTAEQVHEPVVQNFDQIAPMLDLDRQLAQLQALSHWANLEHKKIKTELSKRRENNFIRACHGDVHLGNIALVDDAAMIFDCIEFNEAFRWTDTMADLGFLAMDLEDVERPDLANLLVNQYLQTSGDYHGLSVLRYYKAYRAVVRAKITLFQLQDDTLSDTARLELESKYQRCADLADYYREPAQPLLLITHGVAASGKSTLSNALVSTLGCISLSSDLERKRMLNLDAHAKTNSPLNQGIYNEDINQQTYERLYALAKQLISYGYPVIVDATFIRQEHRAMFNQLAQDLQVPHAILHCQASAETLEKWLHTRHQQGNHPSEARPDILQMQQDTMDSLDNTEKTYTIAVDMEQFHDINTVLEELSRLFSKENEAVA